MKPLLLPLLLLLLPCLAVAAPAAPSAGTATAAKSSPLPDKSDPATEEKWAAAVSKGLKVGKAVRLKAAGHEVFALYTAETLGKRLGGVILLHDAGEHPDWPEVIHPLRVELPRRGFDTLSVQMPVLPDGHPIRDYAGLFGLADQRIAAAVSYLRGKGVDHITLVGYGLGALMGANYLAQAPHREILAFAAIGMPVYPEQDPHLDGARLLQRLELPVFDLYGDRDYDAVVDTAGERRTAAAQAQKDAAAKAKKSAEPHIAEGLTAVGVATKIPTDKLPPRNPNNLPLYRQVDVAGADHGFHSQEGVLVTWIYGWIKRYTLPQQF